MGAKITRNSKNLSFTPKIILLQFATYAFHSAQTEPRCGDILYWELPNTHTQGIISHKIFVRPDASKPYEDAIIPDIPLPETWENYRDGIDPCWKWVLER